MKCYLLVLLTTSVLANTISPSSSPHDASVALLDCQQKYPNVYFDVLSKQWLVHNANTKCYDTDQALLDLCKSVYPGLPVTNIMRMSQETKFTVYACSDTDNAQTLSLANNKGCKKVIKKSVTPYKCLYGDYKSSDLAVPPKCEFMHLYSNDECQSQEHWSLLATEKCKSGQLSLNASSLLKWCDTVGTFKGIEFVCCPKQLANTGYDFISAPVEDEDIDDDYGMNGDDGFDYTYDYAPEVVAVQEDNGNEAANNKGDETRKLEAMKSDMNRLDADEFIATFNKVKDILDGVDVGAEEKSDLEAVEGTAGQKEQYEKQKNFIIISIQNSTEALIKEKQSTLQYITRGSDPKTHLFLEPILRNFDNQFQVRFDKLNKEKDRLLLQEEISYEQQVQGRLNEKKLTTVKELNLAIQELSPNRLLSKTDLKPIVLAINNFNMAQENDRLHMISVYKRLKAYFPEQVFERAQSISNHLESIDTTLKETTSVFTSKFKLLSKCVLPLIREHLKRYDQVRDESKMIRSELKNLRTNYIMTDLRAPTPKPEVKLIETATSSQNTNVEYYDVDGDWSKIDEGAGEFEDDDYMYYDDEMDSWERNETDYYEPILSAKNEASLFEDKINIKRVEGTESRISVLIILLGICLGIFVSLLLMFTLIKKKRWASKRAASIVKHGFLPVETSNPEDRLTNQMQTNGYENPTYKYFEATATTTAQA